MSSELRVDTIKLANGNTATASGLGIDIGSTGKIGQVVNFTTSTQLSSGSSSYVDTNLVASITPSATSSKIYVQAFSLCGAERANAEASFQWKLLRDSTDIWVSGSQSFHIYVQGTSNIQPHFGETLLYIDSPSSTSSSYPSTSIFTYETSSLKLSS